MTERAKETNRRKRPSRSHRLGVWADLWEFFGCCPDCAAPVFTDEGCVMVAPGAKGSFPSSTDDATNPKNIIALSNPHTRTTGFQETRMYISCLRGRRAARHYGHYTAKTPRLFMNILPAFLRSGVGIRDERQRKKRRVEPRPQKCLCRMVPSDRPGEWRVSIAQGYPDVITGKGSQRLRGFEQNRPSTCSIW